MLQGPAVARLRPDLNYEPDIFYVPTERLHQLEEQRFSGAPNLVVEVLSDSTRSYDLGVKASNYRRNEVPEYWAVDTANRVLLRHLLPSEPQSALPGIAIELRTVGQPGDTRVLDRRLVAMGRTPTFVVRVPEGACGPLRVKVQKRQAPLRSLVPNQKAVAQPCGSYKDKTVSLLDSIRPSS